MKEHTDATYETTWIRGLSEVDKTAWNVLALPLKTPFLEWDWLNLMETSGSITPQTGWLPHHLIVRAGGRLIGAAPLYVKTHSAGEFVFDHAWAEVAEKMGIHYYPKLVGMSPVTPVPGYRFLTAPDVDEEKLTSLMVGEIDRFCRHNGLSGSSFLFVDPRWRSLMAPLGFTGWAHQSFAWRNHDCRTFEDYLAPFNANQRRNIRRERKKIADNGIVLKPFAGDGIPRDFFPHMYRLYVRTNDKFGPWGCRYLNREFFEGLHDRCRHRLMFMAAYDEKNQRRPIGMSLFAVKGDRLFGRYWGSDDDIDHLHFNACYYSPIQWAIENGIRRFDPGLGGPHKHRRGFTAVANFSLHRFYDPRMRLIMENHMDEINRIEQEQIDRLNQQLPFAKTRAPANRS